MRLHQEQCGEKRAFVHLNRNTDNRPLSERHIDNLAREMTDGRWKENGDTIVFSGDRLIDGQHRLWAITRAKVTIPIIVVEGVDDAAFLTKDIGRRRNSSDMLAIAGLGGGTVLAAAAALHRYLIKNSATRAKASQGIVFAVMLKAWNAERAGRRVQLLSFKPTDEAFPKLAAG